MTKNQRRPQDFPEITKSNGHHYNKVYWKTPDYQILRTTLSEETWRYRANTDTASPRVEARREIPDSMSMITDRM